MENIRPDFKYYIVPGTSTLDIISEGNIKINDASTAWKLQECTQFTVNFPEANKRGDKYYTTLYTDFAYTLPKGVTAMKVTAVSDAGVAKTEEISGRTIPAQTPILLVSTVAAAAGGRSGRLRNAGRYWYVWVAGLYVSRRR